MDLVEQVAAAFVFGLLAVAVYRLTLHPLHHLPGPKLAAITGFYQAYFDIIQDGGFLNHLRKLHAAYGPVVRIGPNTLHFASVKAFHDIYTSSQAFTKYRPFYESFAQPESSFTFIDPQQARTRRALLNPLFSRRAILNLEGVVQSKVEKLVERLSAWPDKQRPVNMNLAFRCTTLDIITEYCFANCFNGLDAPDFHHPLLDAISGSLPDFWKQKHFPVLLTIIETMPEWLVLWLNPQVRPFLDYKRNMGQQIDRLLADPEVLKAVDHETIYHHMLNPAEKHSLDQRAPLTRKMLLDEALTLIGAGTDTVGLTSTIGTFHTLYNPEIALKLKNELRSIWPDPETSASLAVLEKLPYLTAVIKESLRFAHGIVSPLPRVVGEPLNAIVDGLVVPTGTAVGMSCVFLHESPEAFKDPLEFSPERWLSGDTRDMEPNLAPFSKGPRMCLGSNLAWCELYLIFANVFRKLDMTIANTTPEDMRSYREYLVPLWRDKSLNVVVKATGY